jgi:hypothetical protein
MYHVLQQGFQELCHADIADQRLGIGADRIAIRADLSDRDDAPGRSIAMAVLPAEQQLDVPLKALRILQFGDLVMKRENDLHHNTVSAFVSRPPQGIPFRTCSGPRNRRSLSQGPVVSGAPVVPNGDPVVAVVNGDPVVLNGDPVVPVVNGDPVVDGPPVVGAAVVVVLAGDAAACAGTTTECTIGRVQDFGTMPARMCWLRWP